jgi:hypothetical protein
MTTPETSNPSVLAKNGRTIGHQWTSSNNFLYTESVTVEVDDSSSGNSDHGQSNIKVVGVDEGRLGDGGDYHSLKPIDSISERMCREYSYQSSLGLDYTYFILLVEERLA